MKNPLTPAGIEPATFRFVAQHLNHCATHPLGISQHINILVTDRHSQLPRQIPVFEQRRTTIKQIQQRGHTKCK